MYKTVNIPLELHKKLKVKSAESGVSISELICSAVKLSFEIDENTVSMIHGTEEKKRLCEHGFPPGSCKVWSCYNHSSGGDNNEG